MDPAIVTFARSVQLALLAVLLIVTLVQGVRIAFTGARGFGDMIVGVGSLLAAVFFVARPNAVLGALVTVVGGIEVPALPR